MKYQVGDLFTLQTFKYQEVSNYRHRRMTKYDRPLMMPKNSIGIITAATPYTKIFRTKLATEKDNFYVWVCQEDLHTYCFYEDEVIGEIM